MSFDAADERGVILAVAIEQGRLAAGLVDRSGEVVLRDRISTPSREVWRSLEQLIKRVVAAAPSDLGRPTIVSVSTDGPIDQRAGAVSPPLVPAWTSFPLRSHLEDLTGLPVVLDTVGAAAVEVERWLGGAIGMSSYMGVLVDRTVESACIIDGVRLRGAHGNAGSIAHVIVEPDGRRCWCGAKGCLSAYVTSTVIEGEMNRPLRRATESIIERTGLLIGRAIVSIAVTLDVRTYFLAGTVIDAFGDRMLDIARREIVERGRLASLGEIRIVEPDHGIPPLVAAASLAH